jgi:hypothetical protein
MTWTKCSERMPDIGVRVLGVNAGYQSDPGQVWPVTLTQGSAPAPYWNFDDDDWWLQDEITHWMPMPAPPAEVGRGEGTP